MRSYILSIFIMLFFCGCQSGEPPALNEEEMIREIDKAGREVTIATVKKTTFQKQLVANGKIEALEKSQLQFKTAERLAGIQVKNGDWVSEGQVLAHLENALLKNLLEKARIDLLKAQNKLREEKINFGLSSGNDSIHDPNILKTLRIKSGIMEAENALEHAQLRFDQTFLKAPFAGVVANLEANVGNYVSDNQVFCTIINPDYLDVSFAIMESEIDFISKGQGVDVLPFHDQTQQWKGVITEINPFVDTNGMIKVKARISSKSRSLFDGLHVKVLINHPIPDVIVIPKKSVVMRSDREVVFTVENGTAKWNYVEIIDENSHSYAVREGLSEQDTIIVSGNLNLSHQAKINVGRLVFNDR